MGPSVVQILRWMHGYPVRQGLGALPCLLVFKRRCPSVSPRRTSQFALSDQLRILPAGPGEINGTSRGTVPRRQRGCSDERIAHNAAPPRAVIVPGGWGGTARSATALMSGSKEDTVRSSRTCAPARSAIRSWWPAWCARGHRCNCGMLPALGQAGHCPVALNTPRARRRSSVSRIA